MNGMNIGLDLLFVLGFGWGVEGVALATIISEYLAVSLAASLILRTAGPIAATWTHR